MAGYAKIWADIFNDEWYVTLRLTERGLWLQLILLAKMVGDTGRISQRNWTAFGAVLGCDGKTCKKILGKFREDGKILIVESGGIIAVSICKYIENQRLRTAGIKGAKGNTGKIPPITRPDQTRPDHSTGTKIIQPVPQDIKPIDHFNEWVDNNYKTLEHFADQYFLHAGGWTWAKPLIAKMRPFIRTEGADRYQHQLNKQDLWLGVFRTFCNNQYKADKKGHFTAAQEKKREANKLRTGGPTDFKEAGQA